MRGEPVPQGRPQPVAVGQLEANCLGDVASVALSQRSAPRGGRDGDVAERRLWGCLQLFAGLSSELCGVGMT